MEPQLTLKDGRVLPLSDEVYNLVLTIVEGKQESIEPALSIDDLEVEFAALFTGDGASTRDLMAEHENEREREERRLQDLS